VKEILLKKMLAVRRYRAKRLVEERQTMGKVKAHRLNWQNEIFRLVLTLAVLLASRSSMGQTIGVWPWRPASPPNLAVEPNEAKAAELIKRLSYTEADAEFLFDITLFLQHCQRSAHHNRC
jgi:hypothetical protein